MYVCMHACMKPPALLFVHISQMQKQTDENIHQSYIAICQKVRVQRKADVEVLTDSF